MHAGRHFALKDVFFWTLGDTVKITVIATVSVGLVHFAKVPALPWAPIGLVGTAVAFLTGFKGNASYNRLWEARQIWGGIVNASRAWGIAVLHLLVSEGREGGGGPQVTKAPPEVTVRLIHRHLAWLTALRFQLRESRAWESIQQRSNAAYRDRTFSVAERESTLDGELRRLLSPEELDEVLSKKNRAAQILALQSRELHALVSAGLVSEHRQLELYRQIAILVDLQGKCERIKNFPYPRQFATMNLIFIWMFIVLLPFGLAYEFQKLGGFELLAIPATAIVGWVFHTMDKVGEVSSNPFEGGANDVPITAMSRAIEIDLLEMIGEQSIPNAITPEHTILM